MYNLRQITSTHGCSKFSQVSLLPEGLDKIQIADPTPRVSDSAGLELGLRVCISKMFPCDADVAGPEATL